MPNYLVTLPESQTFGNQTLGAMSMVIFAADAAGARRAAQGRMDGDGNAQWASGVATVAELVVGAALADAGDDEGWSAYVHITGGVAQSEDPIIRKADGKSKDFAKGNLGKTRLHIGAVALADGGSATYVVDEILTAAGGTFTRAATFRIITVNAGVILTIELVDPGEYTVLPSMAANAVTGGGGSAATLNFTVAASNSYEAIMGQLVTGLASHDDLTTTIDLSDGAAGTSLLTVATVGDGIGEATLVFEIRHNGTAETVLVSTIVHEDTAAAVLTAALVATIVPPRIQVFQHNPL